MTSRVILTDLTPGTNFGVQVRAVAENSVSDWSTRFEFTTDLDLVVPGNITGATWVVSGDSFHAEWDAVTLNVNGTPVPITRYEIELVAGGVTRVVSVTPVTGVKPVYDLSFEANRALWGSPQSTVTFKVRAVDNKGLKGAPSSLLSASNPAPATPTSLVVTPATDQITLSWTGVSDNDLIAYNVYVGGTAGFTPSAANRIYAGLGTTTTYTTTTYTTQYFKVFAQDKFLQESSSPLTGSGTANSPFGADTVAPGVPSFTSGTITNNLNGIGSTVALVWSLTSPPSDLAGYKIRYRKAGTTDTYIEETYSKDVTSGVIALPLAYQNYEFQIRAYDWAANYSAWSGTYTVNSPSNAIPANVTGLVSTPGKDSIVYSWTPVADQDIKNYEVTFSTSSTFASGNSTFLTGTAATLTVGGLSTNTTYYARVRAVDIAGQPSAAWSSTDTDTTGVFPTAASINLTSTTQMLTSPSGGGTTTPATAVVTGTANGTTITTYDYSVDGAAFSATVPTGVSRTGNVVTITGSTMTARTIAVRMSDGTLSDTMTVSKNYDGATGSTGGPGPAGADAYTVLLTNESQTIAAGTTNALANTFTTNVNAYKGSVAQTVTVGTITGGATGITAAVTNNTTTNPLITFTVTTALNTANGSFNIPVTVAGITFTQIFTWSLAFTGSAGSTGPAGPSSDGQAPGTAPTPSVNGRLTSLYVTWVPVTVNAIGGAQIDPVTYEVHLSTTSGFTPSGGTKVTEVSGTSAMISNLPGTTTALSYITNYYIKLVAKDRDGSGTAGPQGSGQISKVASTDVASIGADLIVPGTGFVNALVVNTGGSIQSSNWSSGTAGWKISPTGAEFNDSGSSIKAEAIKAGTLGGVGGSGVINIASGTSLIFNGGYLKSNTYTGTSQATNPSNAGFYLGNDGIRIDQGIVSASALTAGTISGTNTITLSGANAKIVGGTWELSGSGLSIPDGGITAQKLLIQNGQNLVPPRQASWEGLSSSYSGGNGYFPLSGGVIGGVNTSGGIFGPQKLGIIWGSQAPIIQVIMANNATDYNIAVEAGKTYIVSGYFYGSVAINSQLRVKYGNGTFATVNSSTLTGVNTVAGAIRQYGTITVPAGVSAMAIVWETSTINTAAGISIDGLQVEEKQTFSNLPSSWTPPGMTLIDGSLIRTGSIISNAVAKVTNVVPVYDVNGFVSGTTEVEVDDPTGRKAFTINVDGSADFSNLSIRGNVVVGNPLAGGPSTTFAQALPSVVTTSASPTLTAPVNTFVANDIGKVITGTGIPAATVISTINADGSGATMSANATASATITASVPRDMSVSSAVSSANYVKGATGWSIRSDGYAEFRELAADSVHGAAIRANTLDADALTTGTLSADLTLAGTVQTAATPTDLLLTYTSGSTTITTPGTDVQFLNPDDVGLYVVGPGIPPDTKITAVASTTSATISKVTTAAGTNVNGALFRGRTVTMSGAYGIVLQDQYRENVVVLPTNPEEPSLFSGSVVATDLFVNDEFRMFGLNNSLGQGSALTMQGSAYNPTLGPKVSFDWPYITQSQFSGAKYSTDTDPYTGTVSGGQFDSATNHYYWVNNFYGTAVIRCWDTGVMDWSQGVHKAFVAPTAEQALGGMAMDSTHFYFLTKDLGSGVWRQQAITRANVLKAGGAVAGDLFSQQVWSQSTPDRSGISGNPMIAKYGGSTFIAKRNTLNQLCLYRYGNALTPSALNALTTGFIVSGNIQSMTVGKFDFGGNAVFAAITCSGAGSYRQVYFIKVSDDAGVLGNVFGTYTNYNFPLAFAENQVMTVYKGTSTDDVTGKFVTVTFSGKIAEYSSLLSTYATAALKTSMRWRNDGTNPIVGSDGGSAALGISSESNVLSYSAVKRSRFTISSQVPIPDVGGNSPNAVTFYLGVDAGTRWRYDELPKGVKSQTITTLRTSDAAGTTLPMKNGVASKILGNNLEINGDGNAKFNSFSGVAQPFAIGYRTTLPGPYASGSWINYGTPDSQTLRGGITYNATTGAYTVPVDGTYHIIAQVLWATTTNPATGDRGVGVTVNGTTHYSYAGGTITRTAHISLVVAMTAGGTIAPLMRQDSTASINLNTGSGFNFVSIAKIA